MIFEFFIGLFAFVITTFSYELYCNRATRSQGAKMYIGGTAADTFTLYKSIWNTIVFHFKYFIVWCWLKYTGGSPLRPWLLDFAFKFPHSNGRYHVIRAVQYSKDASGDKVLTTNMRNLVRIYLVLFPHTVVSYRHFLRVCKTKQITNDEAMGDILDIEYAANDGVYSIKFDLKNEKNLNTEEDLMFGEIAIDPSHSTKILTYQ